MPLKRVGLFREWGGKDSPSILSVRGKLPPELQAQVAAYLKSGHTLEYCLTIGVPDRITGEPEKTGADVQTDGTWLWMSWLSYYVTHYAIGLPEEFIEHMRSRNWICALSGDERMIAERVHSDGPPSIQARFGVIGASNVEEARILLLPFLDQVRETYPPDERVVGFRFHDNRGPIYDAPEEVAFHKEHAKWGAVLHYNARLPRKAAMELVMNIPGLELLQVYSSG